MKTKSKSNKKEFRCDHCKTVHSHGFWESIEWFGGRTAIKCRFCHKIKISGVN